MKITNTTLLKPIGNTSFQTALIFIEDWYAFTPNRFYSRNDLFTEVKAELKMDKEAFTIVSDYIQNNAVSKFESWKQHSDAFRNNWIQNQPSLTFKEKLGLVLNLV